jgi:hypothetical protein
MEKRGTQTMDKEGHGPWIKRETTHGYRGTRPMDKEGQTMDKEGQTMDKEGHSPWIKRDTTHG